MDQPLFKRIAKPLIISTILILVIWGVITLLLNGFVDSTKYKDGTSIEYSRIENNSVVEITTTEPGFTMLRAGDYSVKIITKDSRTHKVVQIHVDNLFKVSSLVPSDDFEFGSLMIYSVSGTNFLYSGGKLSSYRSGGSILYNDDNPIAEPMDTCLQTCVSLYPYDSSKLIGLSGDEIRAKYVVTVNPSSAKSTEVDGVAYPSASQLITSPGSKSFAVYDGSSTLYYYTDVSAAPQKITLEEKPALGERGYLVSFAVSSLMVVSGIDYSPVASGDGGGSASRYDPGDYTVRVYSNSGKVSSSFKLENHSPIRAVALSYDATRFALSSSLLEIGDISDGKSDIIQPNTSALVGWLDNQTLLYRNIDAIYAVDTEGSSWPVFSNPGVNISTADIIDGKIFTGIIFLDDASQLVYAVIIDPSSRAIDNSLLSYSPLVLNSDYSIRFDGQKFTIYVTGTGNINPAYEYIRKRVPDAKIDVIR